MFKLSSLLLLGLALSAFASPAVNDNSLRRAPLARRETNAERFARGLGPIKPRKLFEVSHVETGMRSRRSNVPPPPPSQAPFTCLILFAPYGNPVCCDPSQITDDDADNSDGDQAFQAPGGACYFDYTTESTASSTGCVGTNDVPLCCLGPNGPISATGPGPYPDTYYAAAVHACATVTFGV